MNPRPDSLSTTFAALADPARRAILARLTRGSATQTELAAPFAISGPSSEVADDDRRPEMPNTRRSGRCVSQLGAVALMLIGLGLAGCSDEEDGCLWNVDDLLGRVRARVADDRVDCGMVFDGGDPAQAEALDCFFSAPSDVGAELLVNHCIDCFALSVYYRTPSAEIFGIHQSAARYTQEPPRRSIVTRCATLVIEQGYIQCSPAAEELYYCAEPESAWEIPEPAPYPPGREPPGSGRVTPPGG